MKNIHYRSWASKNLALSLSAFSLIVMFLFVGCSLLPVSEEQALKETQLRETELEVNVKQTLIAQQQRNQSVASTLQAQQITQASQNIRATPSPGSGNPPKVVNTPEAFDPGRATDQALATQTEVQSQLVNTETPAPFDEVAFLEWMKSANILLYEDMTARLDTVRYVKQTLDRMGLPYKNDGSAKGWFRDDLASGAPGGGPWDLVIIAAEDKDNFEGEFFQSAVEALEQGSSVILEVWYLDQTYATSASLLMGQCGVEFDGDWIRIPPSRSVLFPIEGDHPVLNEPNSGLVYSKSSGYWWDPDGRKSYDVGDLLKLAPGSSASLLLGTTPDSKNSHAALTACVDDRMILQTFSSHMFTFEAMTPLWENYIYNALKARFTRSS